MFVAADGEKVAAVLVQLGLLHSFAQLRKHSLARRRTSPPPAATNPTAGPILAKNIYESEQKHYFYCLKNIYKLVIIKLLLITIILCFTE